MQVDGEQIVKKSYKPPSAFETIGRQETRKGKQELGATMNQQAQELNERVKSPESPITENQKRTESRMNQTQEATPTDTPDAAEYISDVQTVFDESPRGCQREVETGHVEDQLMNGKTKNSRASPTAGWIERKKRAHPTAGRDEKPETRMPH